jgi:hypothetical protein
MTINYEEYTAEISGNKFIKRVNEDGSISFIPMDESNSDYQRYLSPEAEQSTPNLLIGDN